MSRIHLEMWLFPKFRMAGGTKDPFMPSSRRIAVQIQLTTTLLTPTATDERDCRRTQQST
jgi:hypothetical protein